MTWTDRWLQLELDLAEDSAAWTGPESEYTTSRAAEKTLGKLEAQSKVLRELQTTEWQTIEAYHNWRTGVYHTTEND